MSVAVGSVADAEVDDDDALGGVGDSVELGDDEVAGI